MTKLQVFCDGGARGNPGPAASAYLVFNQAGELVHKEGKALGTATNNFAEYQAVLMAGEYLESFLTEESSVDFFLDSQLVVQQINGVFKVKDARLKVLNLEINERLRKLKEVGKLTAISFNYVPREKNSQADKLVNETLDQLV